MPIKRIAKAIVAVYKIPMLTSSFIRPRSSSSPVIQTVASPKAMATGIGGTPIR